MFDPGRMLFRPLRLLLLALWVLTTGSSCSATSGSGGFMGEASSAAAGIGIAVFLIGGGIYCLANTDDCFLDEEVQRARVEAFTASQATFSEGLRRHRAGDPEGLALICLSAQEGYAQAQHNYGAQLLRQEPPHTEEAKMWLQRAALQGHSQADLLLRASGRPSNAPGTGTTSDGSTANTPITCPFEKPPVSSTLEQFQSTMNHFETALYARITENVWLDAEDPVTFKAVAKR